MDDILCAEVSLEAAYESLLEGSYHFDRWYIGSFGGERLGGNILHSQNNSSSDHYTLIFLSYFRLVLHFH
ncbi:MAG: hypothetical protein WAU01_13170 [Saprospiraceae bacterium]